MSWIQFTRTEAIVSATGGELKIGPGYHDRSINLTVSQRTIEVDQDDLLGALQAVINAKSVNALRDGAKES